MMKNNQSQDTHLVKTELADMFVENRGIQWIADNGRNLLIIAFGIMILLFATFRYTSQGIIRSEISYIQSENDFNKFIQESDPKASLETLKVLDPYLKSDLNLQQKYDAMIAEKLIANGQVNEGIPFAERALNRTKAENTPLFSSYSETTLLIANQKFEEALKRSTAFKEELLKLESPLETNLLYAMNLLRIASLEQTLNLHPQELNTWNEWKTFILSKNNSSSLEKLIQEFNADGLSLNNYIEMREKFLKNVQ